MEKSPPPLLGFNNNVRHRGLVFHIQTEDSGVKHARIMTHLFVDGGRIVQSARTEYGEHLGQEDMAQIVRHLMKEQHKAMFVRLRSGVLDTAIESACGPLPLPPAEPMRVTASPGETRATAPEPPRGSDDPAPLGADPGEGAVTAAPAAPIPLRRPSSLSNPGLRRVIPSMAPPASGELEFDVGALEDEPPTRPAAAKGSAVAPPVAEATPASPEEDGRYSHPRPATIFGELPHPGASIFGEKMSEKSLDEVILSYLADDLDGEG